MPRDRISLATGTSRGLLLDLVRSHAPISRVELAERTGLTQATVSAVVRSLIDEGLVEETGLGSATGGKRRTLLRLRARARYAVGLQVGEESNSCVAVDLSGAVVGRVRTHGRVGDGTGASAGVVAQEVDDLLAGLGIPREAVVGVGIAVPGAPDAARNPAGDAPPVSDWLRLPVWDLLADALGLPILLDDEATAAALGDFWSGGLDDAHAHATVYLGSCLGSGLLINGSAVRGATSSSGALGQVVAAVDGSGRCWTVQELAGPGAVVQRAVRSELLVERYRLDVEEPLGSFLRLAAGAAQGDARAAGLVEASARQVAVAVLNLAVVLDLDSITLAGPAFAVAGDVYVRAVRSLLDRHVGALPGGRRRVRVRMSAQVWDAAAVGAAALVLQTLLAPRTLSIVPAAGAGTGRLMTRQAPARELDPA